MAIRENFPPANINYMDGESDGWEYKTTFAGANLEANYKMVCAFLDEEGYQDVPRPANATELLLFKIPTRNKQILLFEDNGYVHNPIKILFSEDTRKKTLLTLFIYNEKKSNHLLKFHKKA